MNVMKKIKTAFVALTFLARQHYERFIQLNPVLLSSSSFSSSVSPHDEQCFPTLFTPFATYSIYAFTCYPPSFILFGALWFSRIFTVSPYTTFNHHSRTSFFYIFISDYNFGSFVSSLPDDLPLLPVLFLLSSFLITDSSSLFFCHISHSAISVILSSSIPALFHLFILPYLFDIYFVFFI